MRLYMTNQHSEELQSHLGSISKTFCKIKKKFPNAARPYLYQDKNFSCFVISSESVIIYLNTLLLAVLLITFLNSTIHTQYQITFRADTESYPVLSVNTYPLCDSPLFSRDRRGAASLRYRNRAQITVFMCEQKPYPEWFSCRRKIYPV